MLVLTRYEGERLVLSQQVVTESRTVLRPNAVWVEIYKVNGRAVDLRIYREGEVLRPANR